MELQIIKEQELLGKHFTIYGTYENPLFLAKDVAEWIGHSNRTMMLKTIDEEEKLVVTLPTKHCLVGLQGNTSHAFLTEDGLYEVLMQSRKPIARQFKREVKLILKQIRQTGGYVQSDREIEFIEKYFPSFKEDTKLAMVKDLHTENQKYKDQIASLEPQAEAYNDLMTADGYIKFIDLAQGIEVGRTKLFDFLRQHKIITKQSGFNVPYGRFTKSGHFKVIYNRNEKGHITAVTMVSPKGVDYIYKLVKKHNAENEFDTRQLQTLASSNRKGDVA